jgi:hypothetical protein
MGDYAGIQAVVTLNKFSDRLSMALDDARWAGAGH